MEVRWLLALTLALNATLCLSKGKSRQCGFPGRPRDGQSSTSSASLASRPGDTALYSCKDGFTLFGDHERVCLGSGVWAGNLPLCELNLALDRMAAASATLWNYRPSMAVDGDGSTCSVTPRTSEQRWWQVDLGQETAVGAVSLQLGQDTYQEMTIFVVQLLSKAEALYQRCATFKGRFQSQKMLFSCNEGLGQTGQYVYIRDDRRDMDHFGLCEVEVFAQRGPGACGDPELPLYGNATIQKDGSALYSCDDGFRLVGAARRQCGHGGHWEGHAPPCEEITCGYPSSQENAEIELLNGTTNWNSEAAYTCKIGYILSSGSVKTVVTCLEDGTWEKPQFGCEPEDEPNNSVVLEGKELRQQDAGIHDDMDNTFGISAIISIIVFCTLLIIISVILTISIIKRYHSMKLASEAEKDSKHDEKSIERSEVDYEDSEKPPKIGIPTISLEDCKRKEVLPPILEVQETPDMQHRMSPLIYCSSIVSEDVGQYAGGAVRHPTTYDIDASHIVFGCGEFEKGPDSGEEAKSNVVDDNLKNKFLRSIPASFKMLFRSTAKKASDLEVSDSSAPSEIMALYSQIDKSKKRKCGSESQGVGVVKPPEPDFGCTAYPISDIVMISSNHGLWNGVPNEDSRETLSLTTFGRQFPQQHQSSL